MKIENFLSSKFSLLILTFYGDLEISGYKSNDFIVNLQKSHSAWIHVVGANLREVCCWSSRRWSSPENVRKSRTPV